MLKATIELFRVHKDCKVKFSVFINDENDIKTNTANQLTVNKFNYMGNDYLKITPYPFITVDISDKTERKDEWSSNTFFNANRRELYGLVKKLNKVYNSFISEKDLFYYDNNRLMLNIQKAKQCSDYCICSSKIILIQPCVIESDENYEKQYEGVFLCINSLDYHTKLTFEELEFLIYELKKLDMSSLAIQLVNTVVMMSNKDKRIIRSNPVPEIIEQEKIDIKPAIYKENKKEIPDI